jgi:hypothetical protein
MTPSYQTIENSPTKLYSITTENGTYILSGQLIAKIIQNSGYHN